MDRYLARRCKLSWAHARLAIHRRRVRVNGMTCGRYHRQLTRQDIVSLDDHDIEDGLDDGVVICHKPQGLACSHDPAHAPLLYDHIPQALAHPDLQSAGRLDRDTSGLLVLSIDGRLIETLTSPRSHRWKRYQVTYEGRLAEDAVERVAGGLSLPGEGRPCLPAVLTLGPADHGQRGPGSLFTASLELREGRFHQVKRVFLTLGAVVRGLHRDRIGALELPHDLGPGVMRPATEDEIGLLLH